MIQIDPQTAKKYKTVLINNHIPESDAHLYLKWLRYYLDFCQKYKFEKNNSASLPLFIEKLKSKGQNLNQQNQAGHSIKLFYSSSNPEKENRSINQTSSEANVIPESVSEKSQIKEHILPYNTKIKKETSPAQVGNNNLKPIMTSVPSRSF
jgi:hypothetical protein